MVLAELNARFVSSFYSLFVRSLNATVRFSLAHIFFVSISISHAVSHIHFSVHVCSCVRTCVLVFVCVVHACQLRGSSILRKILIHSVVEH